MVDVISSCSLLIAVGVFKKAYKLTIIAISFIIITALIKLIHNDIIYNTLLIIVISLFARYITNKPIKLALLALVIYYTIAFGLSVNHIRDYSDSTWETVTLWSSLYVYVYYATISLIFMGLMIGGQGGRRVNSSSNNMFHSDSRSIVYERIRSKFN